MASVYYAIFVEKSSFLTVLLPFFNSYYDFSQQKAAQRGG